MTTFILLPFVPNSSTRGQEQSIWVRGTLYVNIILHFDSALKGEFPKNVERYK